MLGLVVTCLMVCGSCFLVVVIGYCSWGLCMIFGVGAAVYSVCVTLCVNSVVTVATFGFRVGLMISCLDLYGLCCYLDCWCLLLRFCLWLYMLLILRWGTSSVVVCFTLFMWL